MASVTVIGIRHHSPSCSHLVKHSIEKIKPDAVLIEGPCDFTPRINELLLDHDLPIALYSYMNNGESAAQSWFPFLEYSPEYVALQQGRSVNAALHFIDLPHWHYRAVSDNSHSKVKHLSRPARYTRLVSELKKRFHTDSEDTLWDHLFESVSNTDHQALTDRLNTYFEELRGDDSGSAQDQLREQHMSDWLNWADSTYKKVVVVCGGWHKPVLENALQLYRSRSPAKHTGKTSKPHTASAPQIPQPDNNQQAGSYLVPYAFRQVDALSGYSAGMPSPHYYQHVWESGTEKATGLALQQIVNRIRKTDITLSTADLLAFEHTAQSLASLRGHTHPLRTDLLDALQSAVIKEALQAPAPWSQRSTLTSFDHPVLREALLALTGDKRGTLAGDTPLPPIIADVEQRLAAAGISLGTTMQKLALDRRRSDDIPKAQLLWQLRCLDIHGIELQETRSPGAARSLIAALDYQELWQLRQTDYWHSSLIEAAAFGASLPDAARQKLQQQLAGSGDSPLQLSRGLMQGVRAGFYDIGKELATALHDCVTRHTDHGELAQAANELCTVALSGFWGEDPRTMLQDTLALIGSRLLWLLDERQIGSQGHNSGPGTTNTGGSSLIVDDVQAVAVFQHLLRLQVPALDSDIALETLNRLAQSPTRPPALRGAALGVVIEHLPISDRPDALALVRAQPPRDALGDFLYGLFACAREKATESDALISVIHEVVDTLGNEDFLVALPGLRAAFSWFPSRERGALATLLAPHLGLQSADKGHLLINHNAAAALLNGRTIEAQALHWARELDLPL